MRKYTYLFLLAASAMLFKSCFEDDLSNCPAKLQVYFESVMTKYKYEDVTDRLDLFLYNGMDVLAETYSYSKAELEAVNYRPTLPLGSCSRYTLLALVNATDSYEVTGTDILNTFHVSLKSATNDSVRSKQSELFFARKELAMTDFNKKERCLYQTLSLYKNTNHIFINIAFESTHLLSISGLNAYIKGNNGSFDQHNNCHANSNRVYLPHKVNIDIPNAEVQFQFTTMQLRIGSDLALWVEDGKEAIINLNIIDQISKFYDTNEKLDQEDHFYFNFRLNDDFTIFELTVNGWYIIRSGIEV